MTIRKRPVSVLQLPKQLGGQEVSTFMREMGDCMGVERPQLVLDCSAAPRLDNPQIQLLLRCLEEAMKRNGDVKLSGIPVSVHSGQDLTGIHRLFESFDTTADAVDSFHQLPSHGAADPPPPCTSPRNERGAAHFEDASSANMVNNRPAR